MSVACFGQSTTWTQMQCKSLTFKHAFIALIKAAGSLKDLLSSISSSSFGGYATFRAVIGP